MDFTVDYLQNAPQEPCDVPHGPSIADDDLRLETSNRHGGFTNESLFPDDWSPLSVHCSGDDEPVNDSARAAHGESTVSDSAALDVPSLQPVIPQDVHDSLFARNLLTNCDVTGIVLPWETGILRDLLSDDPVPLVPKMPISNMCQLSIGDDPQQVAAAIARVASKDVSDPVFSKCISSGDDAHYHDMRRQLRDAAIGKLLIVLRHCLLASKTGRHIINLGTDAQQQAGAFDIVDSVVGVRSPNTVVKRANALLSFLRWVAKAGIDEVNPFVEPVVWSYFQHLRSTDAAASKADSCMSAFRFAFFILGFESLEGVTCSRRLVGLAEIMLSGKRLLKQALVLTVHQVKCLHLALRDRHRHATDRALIGYVLFCLYGRCRNSDLQAIHKIELDFSDAGGFVVITTCNHKSGRMAALKTKLLPIVIPARGVDGSIWPQEALDAMREAGHVFQNPVDGPLFHAPSNGFGDFMKRGLRSSEVSAFLRKTLNLQEPVKGSDVEVVSSHSLKATLLAWCARYGLSPQTRSMLGRHSSCLAETFAIYSRDLVCAPVAELQGVVDAIYNGSFFPDDQRSGFSGRMISMQCRPVMSNLNLRFVMELFQFAAHSTSPVLQMLTPKLSRMTMTLMLVVNVALTTSAPKVLTTITMTMVPASLARTSCLLVGRTQTLPQVEAMRCRRITQMLRSHQQE